MSWLPKGPCPCSACVMKPATPQKSPRNYAVGAKLGEFSGQSSERRLPVTVLECKQGRRRSRHASNCLNTEVRPPEFRINPKGSPGRKKEWESQRCREPSSGMWRPGVLHHQCPPRPALRLSGAWHQSIDAGLKCAVAGSKPGSGSGGCNAPIRIRIDLNPCCADPLQERVQAAARYAIRSSIQATRPHR